MKRYLALQKILQTGSFSRAADELGYTQSAMSQAIASLEEELGIRLLQRGRSGVRLTPDGEELYP
ncbi:MAG: LysR family transcriptional regulator, partial [Solobacterium sp.]|nr:LysR family transcriptional regulator [Solobacterium sp.]